jgi:hypothetical protein
MFDQLDNSNPLGKKDLQGKDYGRIDHCDRPWGHARHQNQLLLLGLTGGGRKVFCSRSQFDDPEAKLIQDFPNFLLSSYLIVYHQ